MSYEAKILADSISPAEIRLTTFEVTFPRFILAEVNTHRMLSRNSASSRAIPTEKIIERVMNHPFIPEFNRRVTGMGVGEPLEPEEQTEAIFQWLTARTAAVNTAKKLIHVDKSRVNRLLEPFMWHTAIITATDWDNFFALRTDEGAQPEFRKIALMMHHELEISEPGRVLHGEWHLPLIDEYELNELLSGLTDRGWDYWKKVSTGRCARVSYLTHDGKRDPDKDVELHDRLLSSGHLSPFEHIATPFPRDYVQTGYSGNFRGWKQYRKQIPNESDFSKVIVDAAPA